MTKAELRRHLRSALLAQSDSERQDASTQITRHVAASLLFQQAETILFYAARPQEPETTGLWKEAQLRGAVTLFPRVEGDTLIWHLITSLDQLQLGFRGLLEPSIAASVVFPERQPPTAHRPLILVPGLGFTSTGVRLGHGGGHYDRVLATLPRDYFRLGLFFNVQACSAIPAEDHDERLDAVVTESGWMNRSLPPP
jgi:5-formyltetrahydrofolate cyclo-ligase